MSLEKGKLILDELRRLGMVGPEGGSFIPPQTYGDTFDISTPPPNGPFANPAQMMPPPVNTTVPMGNPFQKAFYGSQPAPAQQYMPPEVSRGGGLLGASSRPDQAMTGSQMMTDMASVPDYRSAPIEESVPLNIQRPSAPQPQQVKSVFGDNIIGDVARMAAPLAKKVMEKKNIDPNLNSDGSMQNFNSDQSVQQASINPMQEGNVFPFSSNGSQSAPSVMPQYTDAQARQAQQLRVASESDAEAESVINKVATDVSGTDLITDVSDVDSGNPLNLINTITPAGDSNLFSKRENAEKLTDEIRKKEAESPGFVKRMMSNPNLFPYLAMAFNTMRLDPDPSLNAAMIKTIESNNKFRNSNRTADAIETMATRKVDGSVDSRMMKIAEMVREGQIDPKTAMTAVLKKPDPNWKLMTPEEVAANPQLDPNEAYKIDNSSGDIKAVSTSMFPGEDKQAEEYGKAIVERNMKIVDAGENSVNKLDKIERTKEMILSPEFEAGPFARIRNTVDRLKSVLWDDETASFRVSEAEALESLLGSEVFTAIGELGIGARGLDTVAERKFLEKVLSGSIEMNEPTLLYMVQVRENIQKRAIERFNNALDSGRLDKYQKASGITLEKIDNPKSKYKINSLKDAQELVKKMKNSESNNSNENVIDIDELRRRAGEQ